MPIPSAPIMKRFGEDFCERVIPYWMLSNAAQLSGCHLACQIISFHINKYEMKTALGTNPSLCSSFISFISA